MDILTSWDAPGVEIQTVHASEHCAICTQRTSVPMYVLHEPRELPSAHRSWLVCGDCAAAVVTEVQRAALRTPLRIRIAAGMVAAQRKPSRRLTVFDTDYWELMPRERLDTLLIGFVLCLFAMPPLTFLLVSLLVAGR